MRLLDYSKNVYSQRGEDGILSKVLETIGTRDYWCVEFGAWDGEHLSNTCNLIENHGYSAVMIEGSASRYQDLLKRHGKNQKVFPLNNFVGFTPQDGLDFLLAKTPIPRDFDLLSIDIDGNDYHVWAATNDYKPKVVCIEYNPTIPNEVSFVQPADPKINQCSSLLALTELAKKKGYELVAVTSLNGIYVLARYLPLFEIPNNEMRVLREHMSEITYIFCGQDGQIFITGCGFMPWHGPRYRGRIRQLPKLFRKYPDNYGWLARLLYKPYKKAIRLLRRA